MSSVTGIHWKRVGTALLLLSAASALEAGMGPHRQKRREPQVTAVRLDVRRIDWCGTDGCVTVAGGRQVDLGALADGTLVGVDPVVLLDGRGGPFKLRLLLGPGSVAVTRSGDRRLFVPGQEVHLHFRGTESGRLSQLRFPFDADRAVLLSRWGALLRDRDFRVTDYETLPMSGPVHVVTPERGATLSLTNAFVLDIPPGAVRRPTAVSVLEFRVPNRLSSVYTLEPDGLSLRRPATVRLRYQSDLLPPGEPGVVVLHDGERLPTTPSAGEAVVSAPLSHFSSVWVGAAQTAVPTQVAPGVDYYDWSSQDPAIHVIVIDRSLAGYELRVLTEVTNDVPPRAQLRTTPELASAGGALVAINGYLWEPGFGGDFATTGSYQSTTIVDSQVIAETPTELAETMLGFAVQDGTGLRLQKFSQQDYESGAYLDYRYHLLGSNTSLMTNGQCLGEDRDSRWTAIGYAPDKVVMISSDWASEHGSFPDTDLCPVFQSFGVTDAIRLDGGGSPAMVVDGVHVNPRNQFGVPSARAVATVIGLVPVEAPADTETLVVPTDGGEVTTAQTYATGEVVRIEVSGAVVWGGCDPVSCPGGGGCGYLRFGDAQYLTDDCWGTVDRGWSGIDISLHVNGRNVDWGPFNSGHVYSAIVEGTGGPLRFRYNDCAPCYGDNSGSFQVTVTRIADDGILRVPTNGVEKTSRQSYPVGQRVRIEVTGDVVWGGCDPVSCPGGAACDYFRFGDAQYLTDDCWTSTSRGWHGVDISLQVDGRRIEWGPYDAGHSYSAILDGTGRPFRFRYGDCGPCYGDNAGAFNVRLVPIP